ncbi:MAG: hypothetical protein PV354_06700, partial [Bartonella sp.]|nr:hypothetical protein [Bartonella sp.]
LFCQDNLLPENRLDAKKYSGLVMINALIVINPSGAKNCEPIKRKRCFGRSGALFINGVKELCKSG